MQNLPWFCGKRPRLALKECNIIKNIRIMALLIMAIKYLIANSALLKYRNASKELLAIAKLADLIHNIIKFR